MRAGVSLLVLALLWGATGCVGSSHHHVRAAAPSRSRRAFGSFAGYIWEGTVHTVAGAWTVPAVRSQSAHGLASTWIGAQEAAGNDTPFIQVGTAENLEGSTKTPVERYWAFWSDRSDQFRPVFLFPLTQLTEVTARLTLSRGRWTVLIRDDDSGEEDRFSTTQEAHHAFGAAEWLQEDPTIESKPMRHLHVPVRRAPYPQLTPTSFKQVAINGATPTRAIVYSEWMSVGLVDLGPSPLSRGAFDIGPVSISRDGAAYLHIVDQLDVADEQFAHTSAKWPSKTSRRTVAAACDILASALERSVGELHRFHWPSAVGTAIQALAAEISVEIETLRSAPGTTEHFRNWHRQLSRAFEATANTSSRIRRSLGLPQISPIPDA
jgi:Peptidase A4 family